MRYAMLLGTLMAVLLNAGRADARTGPRSDYLGPAKRPVSSYAPLGVLPLVAPFENPWKMLIIMVDFPDLAGVGDAAYFEDMFFGLHGTEPTGKEPYPYPTLADFYLAQSQGQLTFDKPVTVGWYQAPQPYTHYTRHVDPSDSTGCYGLGSGGGLDGGARQLVQWAVETAIGDGVNIAAFDNDGDSQPEGIFVVHAGPGGEQTSAVAACSSGSNNGGDLWSHKYSVDVDNGGNTEVVNYVLGPAASTASGDGRAAMGVWAHEFGHTLGLLDLYAPTPPEGAGYGVGCWDLMGYGIRSCVAKPEGIDEGTDPNEMSVWTRTQLGWATPRDVSENICNRRVEPVQYGGETFKVTPDANKTNEYFLFEYRAQAGFDRDLLLGSQVTNKNRVCVWHIDDALTSGFDLPNKLPCFPNEDRAACANDHYGVSLVEEYNATDVNDVSNYSLPKDAVIIESHDCFGPNASVASENNNDLKPWVGEPTAAWSFRTGTLAGKARLSILVDPNEKFSAPKITSAPGGNAITAGRMWKYQLKLADEAGLAEWILDKYPSGMTIDTDTGLVAWQVPKRYAGKSAFVSIRVMNCGGATEQKFTLEVADDEPSCGCFSRSGASAGDMLAFLLPLGGWILFRRRRI